VFDDPSTSALGYADRQTNRTDVLDLLGSYKSTANALSSDNTILINAITASTAGDLKAFRPNGVAKKEAASTRQTGTSVSVADGASITAGGSILMAAGQTIRTNITAGGAIGIVGLGGSVAILNVNQHTVINFDGVASAGGDFLVQRPCQQARTSLPSADRPVWSPAGAPVAVLSDTGTVNADMGPDAKVERGVLSRSEPCGILTR
jgi:hypothetical protein